MARARGLILMDFQGLLLHDASCAQYLLYVLCMLLTKPFLYRLVGCATVPKTDSWPIDKFLMLPDETFAVMVAQFVFPTA